MGLLYRRLLRQVIMAKERYSLHYIVDLQVYACLAIQCLYMVIYTPYVLWRFYGLSWLRNPPSAGIDVTYRADKVDIEYVVLYVM